MACPCGRSLGRFLLVSAVLLGLGQSARAQNITVGLSQNWGSHFINETRFNFSRIRTQNLNGFAFKTDLAAQLGINGVSRNPIDFGAPTIHFTNYTGITDANPLLDRRETFRFIDNLAYTMNKHTLRAGGEFRTRFINSFSNPTPRGDFSFTGLMTSQLSKNKGNVVKGTGNDFPGRGTITSAFLSVCFASHNCASMLSFWSALNGFLT